MGTFLMVFDTGAKGLGVELSAVHTLCFFLL